MSPAASFLDLATFVAAVILAVWGAKTGLIGELFRFGGMVGGFFVSFMYYRDLQAHMKAVSSNQTVTGVMAFLIIFIVVFFLILGIGFALKKFTEMIMLGWIDNALGAALGILKALLIAWAVCLSISSLPFDRVQTQFGKSVVYKAYKGLPRGLQLGGLEKTRNSFRKQNTPPKTDEQAKDNAGSVI
jgi:membrane protein required for colicin V production